MKTFAYRILVGIGCLASLMLGGCVKNEFKVDFEFPSDYIGNYLMTYYAWDSRGGRWMEHTASIQEGKATADGITRLPTLIYLTDASNPDNSIMLYVERGDKIKVTGDGKDMASWTVVGNRLSERWSEWRKTAYQKKSDTKALHKAISDYVEGHPKDELSSILLLTEWNRREDPEGFVRLWNSIDRGARRRQLVEMCGVTDLLGVEFTATADGNLEYSKKGNVKRLPLRSRDNGTDTLVFDRPAILYFYAENNSARRGTADSLKMLSKAYPDSSKRVMADIYLDSDSMTWINVIRRDSLKGAVRAWQPRGVAEDCMVRLGIVRLPWLIVMDKTGKEVYAGDDTGKAAAAFRKLMGKPDPKAAVEAAKAVADKDKDKEKQKVVAEKEKPKASVAPSQTGTQKRTPVMKPGSDPRQTIKPKKNLK